MTFTIGMLLVCAIEFDGPVMTGRVVGLSNEYLFLKTEKNIYRIYKEFCANYYSPIPNIRRRNK